MKMNVVLGGPVTVTPYEAVSQMATHSLGTL
jgi:hypothetical protein